MASSAADGVIVCSHNTELDIPRYWSQNGNKFGKEVELSYRRVYREHLVDSGPRLYSNFGSQILEKKDRKAKGMVHIGIDDKFQHSLY
jgi:hypothetical protein